MGLESKRGVCPILTAPKGNGKSMQNHRGMPEQENSEMVSVAEAKARHLSTAVTTNCDDQSSIIKLK